jgi:Spy/CpxP family protein refolding chaperone
LTRSAPLDRCVVLGGMTGPVPESYNPDMKHPFVTTRALSRSTLKALTSAALIAIAAAAATPQTVKEQLDVSREAVESQRRVLVSGAVSLTEAEAKEFWPVYDDYEKKRRPMDERANRLVAEFVASLVTLSDARAKAMLDEAIGLDESRLKLRREAMERMAKIIPPRKLARYYQIENKLDSVVRADLARQIPLVP